MKSTELIEELSDPDIADYVVVVRDDIYGTIEVDDVRVDHEKREVIVW